MPDFAPIDALNLLFLPLALTTAIQLGKRWPTLWVAELTAERRQFLQRVVIFLLLPIVVLGHELGHVAAIRFFGGSVAEFHYSFLSGYVVPAQSFPPDETVWLYFSGNLVQIVIGIAAGLAATLASSPPVVALLVYLALWSAGGTAIVYALLSFTGFYGDWVHIYSQIDGLVLSIAIFHAMIATVVLWALYGEKPRLWFTGKTDRQWRARQRQLLDNLPAGGSYQDLVDLCQFYLNKNFLKTADRYLSDALAIAPDAPPVRLLQGSLLEARGATRQALDLYEQLACSSLESSGMRGAALLARGKLELKQGLTSEALASLKQAENLLPALSDPHYYQALVLRAAERHGEADAKLAQAKHLNTWLDLSLAANLAQASARFPGGGSQ